MILGKKNSLSASVSSSEKMGIRIVPAISCCEDMFRKMLSME